MSTKDRATLAMAIVQQGEEVLVFDIHKSGRESWNCNPSESILLVTSMKLRSQKLKRPRIGIHVYGGFAHPPTPPLPSTACWFVDKEVGPVPGPEGSVSWADSNLSGTAHKPSEGFDMK